MSREVRPPVPLPTGTDHRDPVREDAPQVRPQAGTDHPIDSIEVITQAEVERIILDLINANPGGLDQDELRAQTNAVYDELHAYRTHAAIERLWTDGTLLASVAAGEVVWSLR